MRFEIEREIDPPDVEYEKNPSFSVEFDEEDHPFFITPITINFIGTINELDGHLEDIEIDSIEGEGPDWTEKQWDNFLKSPKIWDKLENSI